MVKDISPKEMKLPVEYEHKGTITAIGYLYFSMGIIKRCVTILWSGSKPHGFTYEVTKNEDWEILLSAFASTRNIISFSMKSYPYWINQSEGLMMAA